MNNKGAQTLTSLTLIILLGIGMFTGMYLYISGNATSAELPIPENYTTSYNTLLEKQTNLEQLTNNVSDSLNAVVEAESTTFAVWNGMKGIGTALKIPIAMVGISFAGMEAFFFSDSYMPAWIKVILFLALMSIIVYTVLGALKGEARL